MILALLVMFPSTSRFSDGHGNSPIVTVLGPTVDGLADGKTTKIHRFRGSGTFMHHTSATWQTPKLVRHRLSSLREHARTPLPQVKMTALPSGQKASPETLWNSSTPIHHSTGWDYLQDMHSELPPATHKLQLPCSNGEIRNGTADSTRIVRSWRLFSTVAFYHPHCSGPWVGPAKSNVWFCLVKTEKAYRWRSFPQKAGEKMVKGWYWDSLY